MFARDEAEAIISDARIPADHQSYKDLPALGWRHQRHYDMWATFITLAIEGWHRS